MVNSNQLLRSTSLCRIFARSVWKKLVEWGRSTVSLHHYETEKYHEEAVSGYSVYGSTRKAERTAEGEFEERKG